MIEKNFNLAIEQMKTVDKAGVLPLSARLTLAEIPKGKSAKVIKINGAAAIRQRMMDMGILAGTIIHVERFAPLGDPVHIKLKGYSLALRIAECRIIEVASV